MKDVSATSRLLLSSFTPDGYGFGIRREAMVGCMMQLQEGDACRTLMLIL